MNYYLIVGTAHDFHAVAIVQVEREDRGGLDERWYTASGD